ncbi:MFS transporter [Streptomyces sp. NPDC057582]|uniref:MFS transporter n=1 Tax=Streptomyces sp. NPDC057582 TaxID=3346174 RepID=UPI0036C1CD6D
MVTRIIAGPISDRMGRRKPIVLVAGLVMAASLVIPWVLPTASGVILMAAFLGIGFGAYQPGYTGKLQGMRRPGSRGCPATCDDVGA